MQRENQNEIQYNPNESRFQVMLERALSRPLTAENIDGYADKALDEVIAVIDDVKQKYDSQPTIVGVNDTERENFAFSYFDLPDIDATLDYLHAKSLELKKIDSLIKEAEVLYKVIIPPSENDSRVDSGDGDFELHKHVPRLKTILFILANEFNVQIEDKEQLTVGRGIVSPDMMRKESYYAVDVMRIARTVMVCDEIGNVTYVFDRDYMEEFGITSNDLMGLSKPEINELLEMSPGLGQRIVYGSNFVKNVVEALGHIKTNEPEDPSYLRPMPPEGYLNINAIARQFGVGVSTVYKAIDEIGEEDFGEIQKFVFSSVFTPGYSPDQQLKIMNQLEQRGNLTAPPPEGYLTIYNMAERFSVSHAAVKRAVEVLSEELGETRSYKFSASVRPGYSPDQQEMIRAYLESRGMFAGELPEGYVNARTIAIQNHLAPKTIETVIESIKDELGEVTRYKSNAVTAFAYSPAQQKKIREVLLERGYFSKLPEGYIAQKALAERWSINPTTIQRAQANLEGKLGDILRFKYGATFSTAYSPEQQTILRDYLESQNIFAEKVPEGFVSLSTLGRDLKIDERVIREVITSLGEAFGEARVYKSEYRAVVYYSPEQQKLIRDKLETAGYFNYAPDDYLTENGMATKFGVSNHSIKRVVELVKEKIGDVGTYRTSRRLALAYSPAQQEIIKNALEMEGRFKEVAPASYLALIGIARALDTNQPFVQEAIDALGSELGDVEQYKFNSTVTNGYSPSQQLKIKEFLERQGKLAPRLPEGYMSVNAFAELYKFDRKTINDVITKTPSLGEVGVFKGPAGNTESLSPTQQTMILDRLNEMGRLSPVAPDNVQSLKSFAYRIHTSTSTINKILPFLQDRLGEVKSYRFRNEVAIGFDEEQQRIIEEYVNQNLSRSNKR